MNAFTFLGPFFGTLLVLAVLVWLCTSLVWTWLFFRFLRDVHSVATSLEWIRWAQRNMVETRQPVAPQPAAPQPAAPTQTPESSHMPMSQFGR